MQRLKATWLLGIGVAATLGLTDNPAIAAEQIILRYQILEASVSVEELTMLAETGETSPSLQRYLRLAGRDPEEVQTTLTREVELNPRWVDSVLNSPVGETILDQMTDVVHTRSRQADRQALRSAITLSAQDDGRLSMIEVLQNYPTDEVYVDGDRLASVYNQLQAIQTRLEDILGIFR